MRYLKTVVLLLAGAVGSCAVNVQAGPVEFKELSADAKWVVHFDADAARSSRVFTAFLGAVSKEFPQAKEHFEAARKRMCLDPAKDLHAVTLYGAKFGPSGVVLIIRGNFNQQALQEKVEKTDAKSVDYGGQKIYAWGENAHQGRHGHHGHRHGHGAWHHRGHRVHGGAGAFYKPDVLVLGKTVDTVKAALDVLDSKSANLSSKQSPLSAAPRSGAIFLARAIDIDKSEAASKLPALKLIERIDYAKGENEGQWFGAFTVTAESKSVAESLEKIIGGIQGVILLRLHDQTKLSELVHSGRVTVDDNTVSASVQAPVDHVVAAMPEAAKLIAEDIKKRMHMMHGKSSAAGRHHGTEQHGGAEQRRGAEGATSPQRAEGGTKSSPGEKK